MIKFILDLLHIGKSKKDDVMERINLEQPLIHFNLNHEKSYCNVDLSLNEALSSYEIIEVTCKYCMIALADAAQSKPRPIMQEQFRPISKDKFALPTKEMKDFYKTHKKWNHHKGRSLSDEEVVEIFDRAQVMKNTVKYITADGQERNFSYEEAITFFTYHIGASRGFIEQIIRGSSKHERHHAILVKHGRINKDFRGYIDY